MMSRAFLAASMLVGAAADVADVGVALSRVRQLKEMAFAEELSETALTEALSGMALAEERSGGNCVPDKAKNVECDMNGNQCSLCGVPLAGRGYDGKAVYSSTLAAGAVVAPPDYIIRDDCGNHSSMGGGNPALQFVPLTSFNQKTSQAAFPGWTNAWCETNGQKVCVDAVVNRDYLFQPKTYDIPRDWEYDFHYCKHNGWLSVESRTIVNQGFDAVHNATVEFCASRNKEFPLDVMTSVSMMRQYLPGMLPGRKPTVNQVRYLGAWTCAMGGADGESTGAGCDMAYCHYTYGEIDPAAGSSRAFCMYDDCVGWDPLVGMPVTEYATLAAGLT